MNATKQKVVSWQAPNGDAVEICRECEERLKAEGWPRNSSGEYCQVHYGLHTGYCDYCERTK